MQAGQGVSGMQLHEPPPLRGWAFSDAVLTESPTLLQVTLLCWGALVRVTWEEGNSINELALSAWPVSMSGGIFLTANWCMRAQPTIGGAAPRKVGQGCLRKSIHESQRKQASKQHSRAVSASASA